MQKEISYKCKKIIITSDKMTIFTGIVLIILSFILSGFFAFISVGFNTQALTTVDFYLAWVISMAIVYLCFFGTYVIRKTHNLKDAKLVRCRQELRDFRVSIVRGNNIQNCENWLKIYNYKKRVEIHRDDLLDAYRKIKPSKPQQDLQNGNWFKRNKYKKQCARYKKASELQSYLKTQLNYTNIHFEVIKKLEAGDIEGAEKVKDTIGEDDTYASAKIAWRDVYFNHLFNGSLKNKQSTIFVNEGLELFNNIKLMLLLSFCTTAITTTMLLKPGSIDVYTIIAVIFNLATLLAYAVCAIKIADGVVFNSIFPAEQNKLTICDLFKEDCNLKHATWVDADDLDTNTQTYEEDEEEDVDVVAPEEVDVNEKPNT
ncbi:MAG: hypothetical protein PHV79_00130 [Clostridia bacterium]|jgi:hypothetical protein|nr:hypothetical protein [Clostridia bacterium]